MTFSTNRKSQRGSALLAVLWLSAALSAIAFSVAARVRSETERTITSEEDVRAYYLARGAIDRATLYVQWAKTVPANADGSGSYYVNGQPRMEFAFPSGVATVEIIPEASKLDINQARPQILGRLLLALGVGEERAQTIAAAIVDWRSPAHDVEGSLFDGYYSSLQPSFRARHASVQDIEEILSVQGMTPDTFYGSWVRQGDKDDSVHLAPTPGLRDCVSVFGSVDGFDVNTVQPAVLYAVGAPPDETMALAARRKAAPILNQQEFANLASSDPDMRRHLSLAAHTIYTFRATAQMRRQDGSLSDLKRTVAAMVKFMPSGFDKPIQILRWYDRG